MAKITGVNEETGEFVEITPIERPHGGVRKPGTMVGYTQLWVSEVLAMRYQGLTANEIITFMAVASHMDPTDGIASYSLDEIRKMARYKHNSNASAAIKELIEVDLLRRRDRYSVWVNPNFAWKGKGGHRTIAMWRWQQEGNNA